MNKSRKAFRKLLAVTLCFLMICSVMPIASLSAGAEEKTYAVGDVITFGSYPQTEVTDTTIKTKLKKLAGSTSKWTSYNYMEDWNTVGDYMKYTDVTYNGEKYRGIYFSLYRPDDTPDTASTSTAFTNQDDNGYTYGNTYWFKYEPIEWVILEAGTGGLAVSKNILDSQAYCDTIYYNPDDEEHYGDSFYSYYCNNWEHSTIRIWLNSTFINTAFTTSQQSNIVETTIKTPAYSTSYSQYDSADTSDKVFLLSYTDVQKPEYGFVSGTNSSTTRQKTGTDYAKSQGLDVNSSNGCSHWRLRSAGNRSYSTCYVYCYGDVYSGDNTFSTRYSVVAALYFKSYNPDTLGICATHSYKSVVTAPTCDTRGYATHTCTKCGDSYVDNYVAALGHKWNSGKVTKAATCKATGVKTYTCTVCKTTKTETIAKTAHTYKTKTTAATLTSNGKTIKTCSACGYKTTTTICKIKGVKLSKTAYTYTGKALKPTVTVKDSNGKVIKSTNYTVTYKNNTNVGKATVTVKFKGNYSGTKTLTFTISPKATTLSKVTSTAKAKATVTVKKQATQTTGYEIQYSTSAKFTASTTKTVKITSAKTLTKTISKLTSGKTYYFRVRTYKTVSKVDYTSDWSTSVKAKIK